MYSVAYKYTCMYVKFLEHTLGQGVLSVLCYLFVFVWLGGLV